MAAPTNNKKVTAKTAAKKIVASKKKGLSKKQWTLIGIVAALVLVVGGYFGVQYYQSTVSNAAAYGIETGDVGYRISGDAEKFKTAKLKVTMCRTNVDSGYKITVKADAITYASVNAGSAPLYANIKLKNGLTQATFLDKNLAISSSKSAGEYSATLKVSKKSSSDSFGIYVNPTNMPGNGRSYSSWASGINVQKLPKC